MQLICIPVSIARNHLVDICKTVVSVGAHRLAALFIVLDQHAERLHDGCAHDIGIALTVVRRVVIGNHLVPGRFDRIQPGADLLRKTCVDFFAHMVSFSFLFVRVFVYCVYINGSKKRHL